MQADAAPPEHERSVGIAEIDLRAVIDGMSEGFGLLDADFVLIEVNAEFLRLEPRTRDELVGRSAKLNDAAKAVDAGKKLSKELTEIEQELYQTKNQSNQDPLNFPIKLNNKLAALLGTVQNSDTSPTAQSNQVFEDLATQVNSHLRKYDGVLKTDLPSFNKLVRDTLVPAVILKGAQ